MEEDFFRQPRAADMARMLLFLLSKGGSCNLREWEFHLGYSYRIAIEFHEDMRQLGLVTVERAYPGPRTPVSKIALTKDGEEIARSLTGVNGPFNRALSKMDRKKSQGE